MKSCSVLDHEKLFCTCSISQTMTSDKPRTMLERQLVDPPLRKNMVVLVCVCVCVCERVCVCVLAVLLILL